MRLAWKLALSAAAGGLLATSASAQTATTGTATGTTGTSTGTTSTGSGATSTGGTALGDPSLTTPTISGLSATATTSSSAVNQSNSFGPYFANPYFQGRAGSTNATAPGGFGVALYGTAGTGSSATGGTNTNSQRAGATGGRTGTTTGLGASAGSTTGFGTSGTGGFGQAGGRANQGGFGQTGGFGGANSNAQSGVVVPVTRQSSYTATLSFKAPVATMPQVAADLRGTLDRSTMLSNPRGVDLTMDGAVVVLKGNVGSDDEVRLVENMVRLTPGVRDVRNELKVAPPSP